MINRTGTKKTLNEIQDQLGALAMKEEKDFDGNEITIMQECYNKLHLMVETFFDEHDINFKNMLFKFIDTLKDKYFQQPSDVTENNSDGVEDESNSDDEFISPDFDFRSEICDLEPVTDPDFDEEFYYGENEIDRPQRITTTRLERIESSVFNSEKSSLRECSYFRPKEVEIEPAKLAEQHGILMVGKTI